MKIVILAEKPSQAKAYAEAFQVATRDKTSIVLKPCSIFPNGATITWGIGHLVSLKMPNEYKEEWKRWDLKHLPIIPERFEFKVSEDKKGQFNAVKKLFCEADLLINACDVDAEGSNIFYSILHMAGANKKSVKRLWINSLEVEEVRKGFENLLDNQADLLLYERAKARQISDWLVGINASQLYTLLLQQKGLHETLSVGRVQSPTVYMIYQRQQEIERFVSKPFYEIVAQFTAENGVYEGKAKVKADSLEELQNYLQEKNLILETTMPGTIQALEKKEKRTKSPKLHSLSTLQTVANKRWKYSPSSVLEIMQSLYEKKLVTYPRTDTNFITENEFAYLSNHVESYQQLLGISFQPNKQSNRRYVDGSKVQEHYAIIPTKSVPPESALQALSPTERHIYEEIVRTTLAMFHSDYIYEETKITTTVHDVAFETVGRIELDKGWRMLFTQDKNEGEEKKDCDKVLPEVFLGENVSIIISSKEGHTKPPKAYTEGGLINMMKTCGKMLENEEDTEILKEVEGLGTEATRSGIIETIKKNGYITVTKNIVNVTKKGEILCEAIEGNLLASPLMTAKWETYLRKIGEGNGSAAIFISAITKFIDELIQKAPEQLNTSQVNTAVLEEKASHSKGFCPVCKQGQMIDRNTFVGCSAYKEGCTFSISKTIAGKKISDKHIKDLLEKGSTAAIKGFKSKAGKSFEAKLQIIDQKVKFQFK